MKPGPSHISRYRAAVAGFALGLVALAGQARAQSGFYPEHFDPMPTQGMNLLNLGATQVLANLKPSFGVFLQYIDNPLELVTQSDETVQSRIIKSQLRADVWLALGIADVLDISLAVPFVLAQDGEDLAIFNRGGETIDSFALADIRLIPKIRIIDGQDAGGFGLALQATISFPTGSQEDFTSDGKVRVEPRLLIDWTDYRSGFSIVANVGYHIRPKLEVHNLVIDDSLTWGVGLRIPTPLDALKVVASVFGAIPFDSNKDPATGLDTSDLRSTPIELAAALELSVGDFVGELGGGFGLTEGFGAPDYRLFLAAGYVPRCVDNDGDGICNEDDQCPDEPEDFDGFQDSDGCPDPDNDGDGILDLVDGEKDSTGYGKCRDLPEDKDGFEDEDGCPDLDNDGDGIPDVRDGADDPSYPGFGVCRGVDADKANNFQNTAEDKDGFEDEDGCPDPDNDGDGILDVNDGEPDATGFGRCRDLPEDKDGFQDEDGCPDLDNDGDGVLDVDDGPLRDPNYPGFGVCRDGVGPTAEELKKQGFEPPWRYQAPETVWPGCAAIPIPRCECGKLEIPYKIQFKYGRASLTPESEKILDQVIEVLRDKECIAQIRVEGHTDWHGPDRANLALSEKRAASVEQYLTAHGMKAGRFIAEGYGEKLPLDLSDPYRDKTCRRCSPGCTCEPGSKRDPNPNEAEIRQENRRSVFRIMKLVDPDGREKMCEMPYGPGKEVK